VISILGSINSYSFIKKVATISRMAILLRGLFLFKGRVTGIYTTVVRFILPASFLTIEEVEKRKASK